LHPKVETNVTASGFFGLHLDEDFQTGCFTEIIRGYKMGVVEPDVMRGQQEPPE